MTLDVPLNATGLLMNQVFARLTSLLELSTPIEKPPHWIVSPAVGPVIEQRSRLFPGR